MTEINIIPLVDVVLVLLIIFMVTAPLLDRGIDLSLPQTKTNTIQPEKRYILTIGKNQIITLNQERLSMAGLAKKLPLLKGESIYLRADQEVPYGIVVSVMDLIKQSGIDKLGIVTEPSLKGPS
ncbi:MAG: biopolymer transporter ExbD [Nitrospirae bacterium]|nr:biopolymer transporter ExbD [Candidatus Troglogloeales bacterium]MBI3598521.1 biopolymer transporter ExbD [Candidatus Troglogloeales bacterium]